MRTSTKVLLALATIEIALILNAVYFISRIMTGSLIVRAPDNAVGLIGWSTFAAMLMVACPFVVVASSMIANRAPKRRVDKRPVAALESN